jgi:hypothetical protein
MISVRRRLAIVIAIIGVVGMWRLPTQMLHAGVVNTVVPALSGSPPAQAPKVLVPAALDRQVGQVEVFLGRDLDDSFSFVMLAEEAHAPMGIEMLPSRPVKSDSRVVARGAPIPALVLGPGKLSDALYMLLERQPCMSCQLSTAYSTLCRRSWCTRPGISWMGLSVAST